MSNLVCNHFFHVQKLIIYLFSTIFSPSVVYSEYSNLVYRNILFLMQVMYDGSRVLLQAANSYRDRLRGLCGNFNGEKIDDLMLPQGCLDNNPYEFASAYILPSKSCEPLEVVHNSGFKCLAADGTVRSRFANDHHTRKASSSAADSSNSDDKKSHR